MESYVGCRCNYRTCLTRKSEKMSWLQYKSRNLAPPVLSHNTQSVVSYSIMNEISPFEIKRTPLSGSNMSNDVRNANPMHEKEVVRIPCVLSEEETSKKSFQSTLRIGAESLENDSDSNDDVETLSSSSPNEQLNNNIIRVEINKNAKSENVEYHGLEDSSSDDVVPLDLGYSLRTTLVRPKSFNICIPTGVMEEKPPLQNVSRGAPKNISKSSLRCFSANINNRDEKERIIVRQRPASAVVMEPKQALKPHVINISPFHKTLKGLSVHKMCGPQTIQTIRYINRLQQRQMLLNNKDDDESTHHPSEIGSNTKILNMNSVKNLHPSENEVGNDNTRDNKNNRNNCNYINNDVVDISAAICYKEHNNICDTQTDNTEARVEENDAVTQGTFLHKHKTLDEVNTVLLATNKNNKNIRESKVNTYTKPKNEYSDKSNSVSTRNRTQVSSNKQRRRNSVTKNGAVAHSNNQKQTCHTEQQFFSPVGQSTRRFTFTDLKHQIYNIKTVKNIQDTENNITSTSGSRIFPSASRTSRKKRLVSRMDRRLKSATMVSRMNKVEGKSAS